MDQVGQQFYNLSIRLNDTFMNGTTNLSSPSNLTSPGNTSLAEIGHHSKPEKVYWALSLIILPISAILGNILVIIAVKREKSLQCVTNYFIVSLAFADLFVAGFVMPFAVYFLVNVEWELSETVCDFWIAFDVTLSTSSILNLVAISIDRYMAVTRPIQYAKHQSNNPRVGWTIAIVWLISIAIGLPIVLGLNTSPQRIPELCIFYNSDFIIYSSLGSFYIPCLLMIFLYYRIFIAIHARTKQQIGGHGKPKMTKKEKKEAEKKRKEEERKKLEEEKEIQEMNKKKKKEERKKKEEKMIIISGTSKINEAGKKSIGGKNSSLSGSEEGNLDGNFGNKNGNKGQLVPGGQNIPVIQSSDRIISISKEEPSSCLVIENISTSLKLGSGEQGDDAAGSSHQRDQRKKEKEEKEKEEKEGLRRNRLKEELETITRCPEDGFEEDEEDDENDDDDSEGDDDDEEGEEVDDEEAEDEEEEEEEEERKKEDKKKSKMARISGVQCRVIKNQQAAIEPECVLNFVQVEDEEDEKKNISKVSKSTSSVRFHGPGIICEMEEENENGGRMQKKKKNKRGKKSDQGPLSDQSVIRNPHVCERTGRSILSQESSSSFPVTCSPSSTIVTTATVTGYKTTMNPASSSASGLNRDKRESLSVSALIETDRSSSVTNDAPTTIAQNTIVAPDESIMAIASVSKVAQNLDKVVKKKSFVKFWSRNKKSTPKKREKAAAKRERKATKTLAIVLGVFLFCWVPFFTCNILDAICIKLEKPCRVSTNAFLLTTWLGYLNSIVNPVIYTIFNPEFRKAFKKILGFK